ncbi:unnamed protein product [Allacma fusca]|uniref:CRAL-TRIO domain-containing protein n=1 Tax=Allacma fusca TaxID=39272 RepID=A0A8J2JLX3_9HEXA|nr:unnamed protein product [Allacma fusca]
MSAPTPEEISVLTKFRPRLTDLQLNEERNSDMDLLRWLRAREYNLDRAEDMLRKNLDWRKIQKLDDADNYQPPPNFIDDFPYELIGFDRENCPVVIFQSGRWDYKGAINSGIREEFLRFKEMISERIVRTMRGKITSEGIPVTQFVSIVDMGQISFRQTSISVLQMLKEEVSRFEANYPERLKATYVINIPWFFSIAMNFVHPFLTKRTLEKFNILKDETQWKEVLRELVSLEDLPVIYGGLNAKSRLNPSDAKIIE